MFHMASRSPLMQRQQVQPASQNLNRFLPTTGNINKGLDGLTSILGYTQQFLRVVETTTPIIQEYGPMIKNLPAMYRMLKAFKDINDDSAEAVQVSTDLAVDEVEKNSLKPPQIRSRISTPKLYI